MKKLFIVIGILFIISFIGHSQEIDTSFIDTNSIEYKALCEEIKQIMDAIGPLEPKEYKDHSHLRKNMIKILLSDDNSELFEAIDEEKTFFGNITYWKNINGVCVDVISIVPYDEPNVTVYNTIILNEIINEIKLNFPKNKSFIPDEIENFEFLENHDNLIWRFENNKTQFELKILFNHTQIHSIELFRNIIE